MLHLPSPPCRFGTSAKGLSHCFGQGSVFNSLARFVKARPLNMIELLASPSEPSISPSCLISLRIYSDSNKQFNIFMVTGETKFAGYVRKLYDRVGRTWQDRENWLNIAGWSMKYLEPLRTSGDYPRFGVGKLLPRVPSLVRDRGDSQKTRWSIMIM